MPKYKYTVTNPIIQGEVTADNEKEAWELIASDLNNVDIELEEEDNN